MPPSLPEITVATSFEPCDRWTEEIGWYHDTIADGAHDDVTKEKAFERGVKGCKEGHWVLHTNGTSIS